VSRLFKRLRVHGLIKSVGKTYKYYVTKLGKEVIFQAEKIKELVLIPALNY
jgi:predicted transcriptional regulator